MADRRFPVPSRESQKPRLDLGPSQRRHLRGGAAHLSVPTSPRRPRQPRLAVTKKDNRGVGGAITATTPYRKGMTNGPRRKTGRGGGGGGDNAAWLGGEISSGAAAWCSSGCCPGLSTLHDLTPSCSVQIGQM